MSAMSLISGNFKTWLCFCLLLAAVPSKYPGVKKIDAAPLGEATSSIAEFESAVTASACDVSPSATDLSQSLSGSPTSTQSAPQSSPTSVYGWNPPVIDEGWKLGNTTIVNKCNATFSVYSIGAWRMNGPRNSSEGNMTPEEWRPYILAPGANYTEAFRTTYIAANGSRDYDYDTDKLFGQGVSLKISWADDSFENGLLKKNVTQFEYSLSCNAAIGPEPRLWYDVSLLDCGTPYGFSNTDLTATEADYHSKAMWCPGYQGGLSVMFEPIEGANATMCKGFKCEGKCLDIYNFDRTRVDEQSKVCTSEFRGNMILSLCSTGA